MPDARKGRLARIASFVWRRKVPLLVASAVFLIAFACFVIWPLCTSPDGRYDASMFATGSYNYFEFKDGEASLVLTGIERRKLGTYFSKDGRWVFQSVEGGPDEYLAPGFRRLRTFDSAGNEYIGQHMDREWFHRASTMVETVGSSLMKFVDE